MSQECIANDDSDNRNHSKSNGGSHQNESLSNEIQPVNHLSTERIIAPSSINEGSTDEAHRQSLLIMPENNQIFETCNKARNGNTQFPFA